MTGGIAVAATGSLTLSMTMIGMWEKPFGVEVVSFGNAMFTTTIIPLAPVPGFGMFEIFITFMY